MVEKILNNTTPYGKIRASHEGSLHSSTLRNITADVHCNFTPISTYRMTLLNHRRCNRNRWADVP